MRELEEEDASILKNLGFMILIFEWTSEQMHFWDF